MEEHVRDYASLRLERAREELATASENIAHGRYRAAVSRLYQKARRQREEADYADDVDVDEATARQTLADATRFVDRLERFLHDVGVLCGAS